MTNTVEPSARIRAKQKYVSYVKLKYIYNYLSFSLT